MLYWCKTGKHSWTDLEHAKKCCNGYAMRVSKTLYKLQEKGCESIIKPKNSRYYIGWIKRNES